MDSSQILRIYPEELRAEVKDYFHKWYAILNDLDPAVRQHASHEDFLRSLVNPPEEDLELPLQKDESISQYFH